MQKFENMPVWSMFMASDTEPSSATLVSVASSLAASTELSGTTRLSVGAENAPIMRPMKRSEADTCTNHQDEKIFRRAKRAGQVLTDLDMLVVVG